MRSWSSLGLDHQQNTPIMWGRLSIEGLPHSHERHAMTTPARPHPLDRLAKATARHAVEYVVPLDDDTARAYQAAEALVGLLESADKKSPKLTAARKDLDKAREVMEAAGVIRFRIVSLGRKGWEQLILDHPPTDEQAAEAAKEGGTMGWNPDTFPVAAIRGCVQLVDEDGERFDLDDEQAAMLWDETLNRGEAMALFGKVNEINNVQRVVQMGKDSGRTRGS